VDAVCSERLRPPATVLAAFGIMETPEPVDGGQGTTWRCGPVIVKPRNLTIDALEWQARVLGARASSAMIRLSTPMRSLTGELEVDGWTAWPALEGSHFAGRWSEIIQTGREFAAALGDVEKPEFIDAGDDRWSIADRAAWDELDLDDLEQVPHLALLRDVQQSVSEPAQLIHGDLTGNVLFHPDLAPAVIDLSLYWRPIAYGSAVVVVDAIAFEGAPIELLDAIDPGPHFLQYVRRALRFRIITDHLAGEATDDNGHASYRELVELVCARLLP